MSFYLLPPVSYQTQQKLKKQVDRKKEQKHRRKHSESSNASIRSPKSVKANSIFNKTVSNRSVDEISNLDSLSIHSEKSELSTVSKKEKKHTFNYSYNTDLNEAVRYSSKHKTPSDKRRYNGSIYSPSQYAASNYTASQYQNSAYSSSLYSDEDSSITRQTTQMPAASQSAQSQLDAPIINIKQDRDEYANEDYKNSLDFQLSEDDEDENKLTRVYSDVDSIFSTKVDSSPKSKLKFFNK